MPPRPPASEINTKVSPSSKNLRYSLDSDPPLSENLGSTLVATAS